MAGSGVCVPSRFDGPTVRQIGKAIRSDVDVRLPPPRAGEASRTADQAGPAACWLPGHLPQGVIMDNTETDDKPDTTPDTEPDAPADDTTPNPEPETQDDGEPEDAGDDKDADMANRLSALEATVAELSKTIEAMRDTAADHVLNDGPDDNATPESADMTDDDYNGTYSTFDDLYED